MPRERLPEEFHSIILQVDTSRAQDSVFESFFFTFEGCGLSAARPIGVVSDRTWLDQM